jgi:hypothetical protein
MRISRLSAILAPAVLLLCLQFAAPTPAHADTYDLIKLGPDNEFSFYGLSSSGLAVFYNPGDPACSTDTCYNSFLNGVSEGVTGTAPAFTADNGTPCSITPPAGFNFEYGTCNNGHLAWTGDYGGTPLTGVFFNPTPAPPTSEFGGSAIFLNSAGDAVIDDAFSDDWYYALDLTTTPAVTTVAATTPEPSTLFLLAIGILAPIFFLRRRRTATCL